MSRACRLTAGAALAAAPFQAAAWVAAALALAACSPGLGDPEPWVPAGDLGGPLAPELEGTRFPSSAGASAERLRIVSFNVERGQDTDGLAAAFTENQVLAGADLVLLQEIEAHPAEGHSRARRLADRLAMNFIYAPARVAGTGTHGLAILSRHALFDPEVMQLPYADELFRPRRRIALAATVLAADRRLRVVNVHLDLRLNLTERILQFHPLAETAPEVVVIGGDLNTNPYEWVGPVPLLPDDAGPTADTAALFDDYLRSQGLDTPLSAVGATHHSGPSALRLDSICSRGLLIIDAGSVATVEVSDHVPVFVDLR